MSNTCMNTLTIMGPEYNTCKPQLPNIHSLNMFNFDHSKRIAKWEFQSRWNPPLEELDKLARLRADLNFELFYDEPNCDIIGLVRWHRGKRVLNLHRRTGCACHSIECGVCAIVLTELNLA